MFVVKVVFFKGGSVCRVPIVVDVELFVWFDITNREVFHLVFFEVAFVYDVGGVRVIGKDTVANYACIGILSPIIYVFAKNRPIHVVSLYLRENDHGCRFDQLILTYRSARFDTTYTAKLLGCAYVDWNMHTNFIIQYDCDEIFRCEYGRIKVKYTGI